MRDYRDNSRLHKVRSPKGTVTLQEFYPRRSKRIIDRIDDLLGRVYGLSPDEVQYVKAYDLEFRSNEEG